MKDKQKTTSKKSVKTLKVAELFAGVGGFRIGLDDAKTKDIRFETIWANQWEPSTSRQHAAEIYKARFGEEGFSEEDIELVIKDNFKSIPNHDLLVGGFPCQDYSVAKTLSHSKGLIGKKGVLWWSIHGILRLKGKKSPRYLLLENVDRLLKSPSAQRGRDFAVMLASLSDLGYAVEWRVINAADYGFPQRRRRVYILGYKKNTKQYKQLDKSKDRIEYLTSTGVMQSEFKVEKNVKKNDNFKLKGSLANLTKHFSSDSPAKSPFLSSGVMIGREVTTAEVISRYTGKKTVLGDVLVNKSEVPDEFFISPSEKKQWDYLKGAKKEPRKTKDGFEYIYSEGGMVFPDSLNNASRTIITGEGGPGPSRFKHVVKQGRSLRRLTPIELERLNMFPDNWTQLDGVSDNKRAFIMGNALVVGVIQKLGLALLKSSSR